MGSRIDKKVRGFSPHAARWKYGNLDAAESTYTQAGPRPGSAVGSDLLSRLTPEITANQQVDAVVAVARGGNPGIGADGAQVAYRLESEAATEFRGWDPPHTLRTARALEATSTLTYDRLDAATIPSSQKVVVAMARSAGGTARTRTLSPATMAWGGAVTVTGASTGPVSVCVLPGSERVLMLDMAAGAVFYSDDDGASWSFYSRSPFPYDPPAGSETRARMRVVGDDLILVTEAAGTIQHWASTDLGVSFRLIEAASTHTSTSLAVLPGGVVAVIYLDASNNLDSKIIAGASGSIVGAETVVIDAAPPTFVAIEAWADADGIAYIAAATSAAPGGTIIYSSTDGARTWTRNTGGYLNRSSAAGSVADTIDRLAVAPVLGSAIVIAGVSSSPGTWDGSLFALFCGGWTNVTAGTSAGSKVATVRGGWDQTWFTYTDPYGVDAPNTVWLMGGTQGSIVSAEFLVTTSASTTGTRAAQTLQNTTDTDGSLALQWECKVTSGGSLAAANVSVTAGISESAGSPSWDYHARINMLTTGFRVLDVDTGGTLADVTIDLTTPLVFLMDIEGSALNVWYRRIEDENWTVAFSGSLANGGGGTTRSIVWGHSVASIASSTWYSFAFRQGAACEHTPQTVAGKSTGLCGLSDTVYRHSVTGCAPAVAPRPRAYRRDLHHRRRPRSRDRSGLPADLTIKR